MEIKIDRILNVDGLPCPQPTIIAMETLKKMKLGETLEIISNNKKTIEAINNLCRKRNYTLHQIREKQGRTHFIIQK
jgi:TusA-related sulfurtransferase